MAQTTPVNSIGSIGALETENLDITTSASYADNTTTVIDARKLTKGLITVLSKHATATIKYRIRASIKSSESVPAIDDTSWVTLQPETTLAANMTEPVKHAWSEPWAWIRVEVTNGSGAGTVNVRSRGVAV